MLGRNTYLIPPAPSRPATGLDDGLLHPYLHHPDAFSGNYLADDASVFEKGEPSAARKQTAKKDRHSKIDTAQGPRDRRVRLSIGIARKFFDLQEVLGFDKPSKTLDWLLTKSKAAIKELMVQTAASPKSDSSPSDHDKKGDDSNRKSGGKDKAAKKSRAKARARARERTLEKMCIKQLGGDASDPNLSSYERIKNKNNTNPSSLLGFQQNVVLNSNYNLIPSANENWDVFGLTSQSNLHDQHKFFNCLN